MNDTALGQRNTRQREMIVAVIRDARGPLTVPEILGRAQKTLPGLGVATVYRAIKLLLDDRKIQPVILPSGETRYESSNLGHHHHFHCRACGEVYDLQDCPVSAPSGRYKDGFIVEDHELTLYGICASCA